MPKNWYLLDYISWLEVPAKPEEVEAVQPFTKVLVEDYGYPKNLITTHPQYRVKVRPSDTKKEYPVDIAVFLKEPKDDDSVYIVVECKKQNRKDWIEQLQDYLRFCKAELWVWYNWNERVFLRKIEHSWHVDFEEITNIPRYKQRLEDIWKFKKSDLKPTHNLKQTFKVIRNYLAANAVWVTSDSILAQQLINIIFCKIFDERFTPNDWILSFRTWYNEDPQLVKKRINEIFTQVKKKYKEVISEDDTIILDDKSVWYVVWELQNYSLIDSERDVVADAFEIFIWHALKWDKWQFFTPRNVIKMIVDIMDPSDDDFIIDPTCWSWGFLIESLRYVREKIEEQWKKLNRSIDAIKEEKIAFASTKMRWIDKDAFLTKITKAYMAILWDWKWWIFCEDSLANPDSWDIKTKVKISLNQFSMVLTNPPFWASINVVWEDKLKQYDLWYKWKDGKKTNKIKDKENPQILFLERNLQFLRDWWKLAIILPETYLHAPSVKYVIQYIANNHNIFAVVDLPHNTFRPHCNAKCIVLFVEKWKPQQQRIIMWICEEMWHNHQWRLIYRFDSKNKTFTDEIWDDTTIVANEFKDPNNPNNNLVFTVDKDEIINSLYVPRYYWKKRVETLEQEAKEENCTLIPLSQLEEEWIISVKKWHWAPPSEYKWTWDVFYVRAWDIVDWDIYRNPTSCVPYDIYKKWTSWKVKLEAKDILFVKEWSYRVWDVALLSPFDTWIFLNHHTLVIKVINENNKYWIDPYYLLYLMSHRLTKMQFFNKIMIDTTLPNIWDRRKELYLPIDNSSEKREKIKIQLKNLFNEKWENQKKFNIIKQNLNGENFVN